MVRVFTKFYEIDPCLFRNALKCMLTKFITLAQLAAFMPALHAIHDSLGSTATMPYGFSKVTYTNWVRRALQRRIRLAPYMYTQEHILYNFLKGNLHFGLIS